MLLCKGRRNNNKLCAKLEQDGGTPSGGVQGRKDKDESHSKEPRRRSEAGQTVSLQGEWTQGVRGDSSQALQAVKK